MMKFIKFFSLCFLLTTFTGAENKIEKIIIHANKLYAENSYDEALNLYENLNSLSDCDQQVILFNTANTLYKLGDYENALSKYEKAFAEKRQSIDKSHILYNMGNCHYQMTNYSNAIELYIMALTLDPSCFEAKYNLEYLYKIQKTIFTETVKNTFEQTEKYRENRNKPDNSIKGKQLEETSSGQKKVDEKKPDSKSTSQDITEDNRTKTQKLFGITKQYTDKKKSIYKIPPQFFISASQDTNVHILLFDPNTTAIRKAAAYNEHKRKVNFAQYARILSENKPLIISSSLDTNIHFFDVTKVSVGEKFYCEKIAELKNHTGAVTEAHNTGIVDKKGRFLFVSSSADQTIKIFAFDLQNKKVSYLKTFRGHTSPALAVRHMPTALQDGIMYFASASETEVIITKYDINLNKFDELARYMPKKSKITSLTETILRYEQSPVIAIGDTNGNISLLAYNLAKKQLILLSTSTVHQNFAINGLIYTGLTDKHNNYIFGSCAGDKKIKFAAFDPKSLSLNEIASFEKHAAPVNSIQKAGFIMNDGSAVFVSASSDKTVRIFGFNPIAAQTYPLAVYEGHTSKVSFACYGGVYANINEQSANSSSENPFNFDAPESETASKQSTATQNQDSKKNSNTNQIEPAQEKENESNYTDINAPEQTNISTEKNSITSETINNTTKTLENLQNQLNAKQNISTTQKQDLATQLNQQTEQIKDFQNTAEAEINDLENEITDQMEQKSSQLNNALNTACNASENLTEQVQDTYTDSENFSEQNEITEMQNKIEENLRQAQESSEQSQKNYDTQISSANSALENLKNQMENVRNLAQDEITNAQKNDLENNVNKTENAISDLEKAISEAELTQQAAKDITETKQTVQSLEEDIRRTRELSNNINNNINDDELKETTDQANQFQRNLSDKLSDLNTDLQRLNQEMQTTANINEQETTKEKKALSDSSTQKNTSDETNQQNLDHSNEILNSPSSKETQSQEEGAGEESSSNKYNESIVEELIQSIRDTVNKSEKQTKEISKEANDAMNNIKDNINDTVVQSKELSSQVEPQSMEDYYDQKAINERAENISDLNEQVSKSFSAAINDIENIQDNQKNDNIAEFNKKNDRLQNNIQNQIESLNKLSDTEQGSSNDLTREIESNSNEMQKNAEIISKLSEILNTIAEQQKLSSELKDSANELENRNADLQKIAENATEIADDEKNIESTNIEETDNLSDIKKEINEIVNMLQAKLKEINDNSEKLSKLNQDIEKENLSLTISEQETEKESGNGKGIVLAKTPRPAKKKLSKEEALKILNAMKEKEMNSKKEINSKPLISPQKDKENLNDW